MKKLVSLVLVAVMMLCAVPAFATETTVVNWADLQEQGFADVKGRCKLGLCHSAFP